MGERGFDESTDEIAHLLVRVYEIHEGEAMATLEQIIDEARSLSPAQKRKLRQALDVELEQVKAPDRAQPTHSDNGDDETRERRLEWLKSHQGRDRWLNQNAILEWKFSKAFAKSNAVSMVG